MKIYNTNNSFLFFHLRNSYVYLYKLTMLDKFKSNKNIHHFFVYNATFLGYGSLITALGAMIPYFSFITGRVQTEYSFLFFYRSMGMIFGAVLIGFWNKYQNYHKILSISSMLTLIFSVLFTVCIHSTLYQGIFMFLSSMLLICLDISVNTCVLAINPSHEVEFWMLLTHGVFGIGGLVGPIMVYFLEENTMIYQGIFVALITPFYLKLRSPDEKKEQKQLTKPILEDQENQPLSKQLKYVSYKVENLIALGLFVYVGLQNAFGGWISSYAVISGAFTKEEATKFPSIYWVAMTIFRIGFAFINMKSSEKLKLLINSGIISTIICIILIKVLGLVNLTCYLSAILLGICYSVIFPVMMSLPMQFGLDLESNQTTKIILCAATAEGIISMGIGYLMEWFNINYLFYSLIVFKLILWVDFQQIIKYLKMEQVQPTTPIEMINKT